MIDKLKEWLAKQKKDAKTLLTFFVIVFVLYLIITQDFYNALGAGFGWAFFAAIIINAVRFWRSVARKAGVPTEEYHLELEGEEKAIFNEMMALPNIKELSIGNKIDEIIKEKVLSKNYLKEDWQIHYAKERIKNAIIKQVGSNS